jgi:hypothetical protein
MAPTIDSSPPLKTSTNILSLVGIEDGTCGMASKRVTTGLTVPPFFYFKGEGIGTYPRDLTKKNQT